MALKYNKAPEDEQKLYEQGKRIINFAAKNDVHLEPQGFLLAWLGGTDVVTDETDGEITGLTIFASGDRWTSAEKSAHVLVIVGDNKESMLEFVRTLSQAKGCVKLFYEIEENVLEKDGYWLHQVKEEKL